MLLALIGGVPALLIWFVLVGAFAGILTLIAWNMRRGKPPEERAKIGRQLRGVIVLMAVAGWVGVVISPMHGGGGAGNSPAAPDSSAAAEQYLNCLSSDYNRAAQDAISACEGQRPSSISMVQGCMDFALAKAMVVDVPQSEAAGNTAYCGGLR